MKKQLLFTTVLFLFSAISFGQIEGTVVSQFATNGEYLSPESNKVSYTKSIIGKGGKIITIGTETMNDEHQVIVQRLLPEGELDTNFATKGVFKIAQNGNDFVGMSIGLNSKNEIVVCGRKKQ